ncbi:MAG: UpxY family transcription antiterminator [Ignavibacteriae bacterium]|nr:UpxY family transcription antiterminator [Ignavibacteriota bacterium]
MDYVKKWHVIQTRPKNEKKVYEQILRKDIEAFLPLVQTVRYWSDRKKKLDVPLFPGYVFVNTGREERIRAISNTYGALRYLMYQKKPAEITESEIKNIKLSLQAPEKIRLEENAVTEGDLVEITGGVFRGLTGYIKELRGNYKLIVNITELNSTFSVQLSNSEIKLLRSVKNTYH